MTTNKSKQPKAGGILVALFLVFTMFQPNETASESFFVAWVWAWLLFAGITAYVLYFEARNETK